MRVACSMDVILQAVLLAREDCESVKAMAADLQNRPQQNWCSSRLLGSGIVCVKLSLTLNTAPLGVMQKMTDGLSLCKTAIACS